MEMKEWKGFCDLHLHTTNSDGKYTPYELSCGMTIVRESKYATGVY